ncbi:MAG: hypothetical protein RLZZ468_1913 [Cyanobacteriota bacterium]
MTTAAPRGELVRRDGTAGMEQVVGLETSPGGQCAGGCADADQADGAPGVVSLRAEVPAALLTAMRAFIEQHPNWDQYRLFQAALAGFLVQNGVSSRDVTRCYLANLFPAQRGFRGR